MRVLVLSWCAALSLFARSASPENQTPDVKAKANASHEARATVSQIAVALPAPQPATPAATAPTPTMASWATALAPVRVENPNARLEGEVRLYGADGAVDLAALAEFRRLVGDGTREAPVMERTIQLALRAAYHFDARTMVVISAYRPGRHNGPHGQGRAIDFKLKGVSAAKLAAYLRTTPRAGVGIYTHPDTQFVHLDVRDMSWHWLDGSPPGKKWREMPLPDAHRAARDASYAKEGDLPEAATASTR